MWRTTIQAGIDCTCRGWIEQESTEITEIFSVSSVTSVSRKDQVMHPVMHPLSLQASGITHDVIGAAIEVHKDKGPGLLESIYEWCLTMELGLRNHQVQIQDKVVIQ